MLDRFEFFSSLISAISRDIQRIEKDEMDRCGFRGAFARYLVVLSHHSEGLTAAELCALCDRDKAAVSRILAEMETRGLVCRTGGQSYRARVTLTPLGKETAGFVARRAEIAVQAAGKGFSDEERQCFYAVLSQIAANLQTLSKSGLPAEPDAAAPTSSENEVAYAQNHH